MALLFRPDINFQAGTPTSVADDQGNTVLALIPAFSSVTASGAVPPAGTSADPTFTQTGPLPAGTDRSGSATTASTTPIAANTARRGLNIQNIGANNIGINEFGGTAVIGTAGTYTLIPNAFISVRTNRAISVIAATATTAYTATEF